MHKFVGVLDNPRPSALLSSLTVNALVIVIYMHLVLLRMLDIYVVVITVLSFFHQNNIT